VCPANLDDILELARLGGKGIAEFLNAGHCRLNQDFVRCNVHCCRKRVVRRLRLVHVVVRREGLFLVKQRTARQHVATVRHHFIDVHIALRTRAGLPDDEREGIVEFAVKNFLANAPN
jgi:hypothetical protein